jgi:uncharacterized membrane protein
MLAFSTFYLLFLGFKRPEKENIEHVNVPEPSDTEDGAGLLKILKGNEKRVIEALMEYGEMNQADLSARTGIPKSTLSRALQDLEDQPEGKEGALRVSLKVRQI